MNDFRAYLEALPFAVCAVDARGALTYFNDAAASLWGREPVLGETRLCGSQKLYRPDGTPLPHEQSPTALALERAMPVSDVEIVIERPDGARVHVISDATPIFDDEGSLQAVVNVLRPLRAPGQSEQASQHLAAIVQSSEDAILTKDLDSIITSWNRGAERIFGYSAKEAIGRPITIIFPEERHSEEAEILARIRSGEAIQHYETVRQRKDGERINISLSVSPVRDAHGRIVGASKIARDITERVRAQEQRELLLREMNHRVKNLFSMTSSVLQLSARKASTPAELAQVARARIDALSRAHALTLPTSTETAHSLERSASLHALIETVVSPYSDEADDRRVTIDGVDVQIAGSQLTSLALLLHEFATNAAKYGALSSAEGHVSIECADSGDRFDLTWTERGGPPVKDPGAATGFGSQLARMTVERQLGGELSYEWDSAGLVISMSVDRGLLLG